MPKIPTYESSINPETSLPGGPARVYAEPASFGAGRGLSDLASGLEDASTTLYDTEQRQEVSDISARAATLRGSLTAQFLTGSQKANGTPDFTDKFMEGVTNQLDSMRGTIQTKAGQQAFDRESASITSDFLGKTTEYSVAVAAAKATSNFHTMVNENAGTLFNDPSQAASIFKNIDQTFADPSGPYANVPAEHRDELLASAKESLAIAAGRGVAMQNPDLADKLYKGGNLPGQGFLTEAGNAQMVSYITTMQNAERTKQSLAIAQEERDRRIADENSSRDLVGYLVAHPNDPAAVDKILNSHLTPEHQIMFLALAGHSLTDQAHDQNTYGPGFYQAWQDIAGGKIKSQDDLIKQVGPNGTLSLAGVQVLGAELAGKHTPQGEIEAKLKEGFVKAVAQQISGTNELLKLRDPNGEAQMQSALAWLLPEYERQKQEGKYPPQVLLDPKNPHSLWAGAMHFKRSQNQYMRDLMDANPGADMGTGAKAAGTVSFKDLPK